MTNALSVKVMRRKRHRSISLSDEMINDIRKATKDCISVSGFIRMAVKNELEKYRNNRPT